MSSLILAIPEALGDLWWVYQLALLAVILIAIVILSLLKRQDFKRDGEKNIKHAATQLEQCKTCAPLRRKAKLLTAENLLRSAIYNLSKYAEKHDAYELNARIDVINTVIVDLKRMQSLTAQSETEQLIKELTSVLIKLGF